MNTSQAKAALETMINQENQLKYAAELKTKWSGNLDKVIRPPSGFSAITLPPREPIMGKWFRQGDLGFIYGPRGLGKTWLGMFLGRRCAEGAGSMGTLAEWSVATQRRVLYVDGEMTLDESATATTPWPSAPLQACSTCNTRPCSTSPATS